MQSPGPNENLGASQEWDTWDLWDLWDGLASLITSHQSLLTSHSRLDIEATTRRPSLRRRAWSSRWDPTPRLIDLRAIFFSPGRAGGWSCRSARFLWRSRRPDRNR